jgi:hypothetical protein
MITVQTLLLLFAFVCFIVAAWLPAQPQWNRLIAAGLAAFVLAGIL